MFVLDPVDDDPDPEGDPTMTWLRSLDGPTDEWMARQEEAENGD